MTDDLREAARTALACLDLTSLNPGDTAADIEVLCRKARSPFGDVAAVCVWPRFVAQARAALPGSVRIAAVANFPDGALAVDAALRDAAAIVETGGDEVDLVLPWRAFAAGEVRASAALVAAVRRATPGHTLKLILESGELQHPALIAAAARLGLDEGADFLKTSTGTTKHGASLAAASVMLEAIAGHARGAQVGFKASGGIRRVADAAPYIALTRERLGAASAVPKRLRFGASGLLGDIEATLGGHAPAAATGGY